MSIRIRKHYRLKEDRSETQVECTPRIASSILFWAWLLANDTKAEAMKKAAVVHDLSVSTEDQVIFTFSSGAQLIWKPILVEDEEVPDEVYSMGFVLAKTGDKESRCITEINEAVKEFRMYEAVRQANRAACNYAKEVDPLGRVYGRPALFVGLHKLERP